MKIIVLCLTVLIFFIKSNATTKSKKLSNRKPDAISEIGSGPFHVVCDDGKGNIKIFNVNSLDYYQQQNIVLASGFAEGRQGDRAPEELEGNCKIRINSAYELINKYK